MESDDMHHVQGQRNGQVYNVTRQSGACLSITRQRKVAETPKLTGSLSEPRVTFVTSFKVKGSKVKVTRSLNAVIENQPYLQTERACKVTVLQAAQLV